MCVDIVDLLLDAMEHNLLAEDVSLYNARAWTFSSARIGKAVDVKVSEEVLLRAKKDWGHLPDKPYTFAGYRFPTLAVRYALAAMVDERIYEKYYADLH